MTDISPRRKFAGRALLAGAALMLPLTASIGYAENVTAQAPLAPVAPQAATLSLAPPAPPVLQDDGERLNERDVDVEREVVDGEGEFEAAERAVERHVIRIERRVDGEPGAAGEGPMSHRIIELKEGSLDDKERAQLEADLEAMHRELGGNGSLAQSFALVRGARPEIIQSCQDGQEEVVVNGKTDSGREALFICLSAARQSARRAVEGARRVIQSDRSLSESERAEALRSMDEALAGLRADG